MIILFYINKMKEGACEKVAESGAKESESGACDGEVCVAGGDSR